MEYNDDIEKLLQQYGRQQQLVSHVRHLAHVQARRRAWVVCTLLVLLGSIGIVRMLSTSQTLEQSLVAQQVRTVSDNTAPVVDVATVKVEPKSVTAPTKPYNNQIAMMETPDTPLPSTVEEPSLVAATLQGDTADSSNFNAWTADILPTLADSADKMSAVPKALPSIDNVSYSELQPPVKHNSRLHFISSVTASLTPLYGTEESSTSDNNTAVSDGHSVLSPYGTLMADVGAAITVAGNERHHFDIGFTLGGHYQQGELLSVGYDQMLGVDGSESEVLAMQSEGIYGSFSLYASLPLTFNIAPRDNNSVGWSLSLTPAHSISLSHMLGGIELNPWRLTLGVGVLFPKRYFRRVSLIANLLPLYLSYPIHEIGIEIGF